MVSQWSTTALASLVLKSANMSVSSRYGSKGICMDGIGGFVVRQKECWSPQGRRENKVQGRCLIRSFIEGFAFF